MDAWSELWGRHSRAAICGVLVGNAGSRICVAGVRGRGFGGLCGWRDVVAVVVEGEVVQGPLFWGGLHGCGGFWWLRF